MIKLFKVETIQRQFTKNSKTPKSLPNKYLYPSNKTLPSKTTLKYLILMCNHVHPCTNNYSIRNKNFTSNPRSLRFSFSLFLFVILIRIVTLVTNLLPCPPVVINIHRFVRRGLGFLLSPRFPKRARFAESVRFFLGFAHVRALLVLLIAFRVFAHHANHRIFHHSPATLVFRLHRLRLLRKEVLELEAIIRSFLIGTPFPFRAVDLGAVLVIQPSSRVFAFVARHDFVIFRPLHLLAEGLTGLEFRVCGFLEGLVFFGDLFYLGLEDGLFESFFGPEFGACGADDDEGDDQVCLRRSVFEVRMKLF